MVTTGAREEWGAPVQEKRSGCTRGKKAAKIHLIKLQRLIDFEFDFEFLLSAKRQTFIKPSGKDSFSQAAEIHLAQVSQVLTE